MSVLDRFVRQTGELRIVSDGDMDGIFATGLLLRYADAVGVPATAEFPPPAKLDGLQVHDALVIELPTTKGVRYVGDVLLIDHHNNAPHVQWLRGRDCLMSVSFEGVRAASDIVVALKPDVLPDTPLGRALLDAVADLDQGLHESQLAVDLHHAYALDIEDAEMRTRVAMWVREGAWEEVVGWVREARERWRHVEGAVGEMVASCQELLPGVVWFLYSKVGDRRVAMRQAMLTLEETHPVVIALQQEEDGTVSKASFGTKRSDINLLPLFETLRDIDGVTSGGRERVGGAAFPPGLRAQDILEIVRAAIERTGIGIRGGDAP